MDAPADFSVDKDGGVVTLTGDWTVTELGGAVERLGSAIDEIQEPHLDLRQVGRVDTAGVYRLIGVARGKVPIDHVRARPETLRLVRLVIEALDREPAPEKQRWSVNAM